MHAQPPFFERLRHKIGRPRLFVAQFGMGMDASSEGLDFVSRGQDFRNEFHDAFDLGEVLGDLYRTNHSTLNGVMRNWHGRAPRT